MKINGVIVVENFFEIDSRGYFKKTYNGRSSNLDFKLQETFISFSKKGSVRGMHLQLSPHSGIKIVTLLQGSILDVLLDLRTESTTYLHLELFNLNENSSQTIIIPEGVAHGFQAVQDSLILYHTDYVYEKDADTGVNIQSLGIQWPLPISSISNRDSTLPTINEWKDNSK